MGCNYRLGLCKLRECKQCEYVDREEECPWMQNADKGVKVPTIQQMIDVYGTANCSKRHKDSVINSVLKDIAIVGLDANAPYTMMTRDKFKLLIASFRKEDRKGGKLRDYTIESHLAAFRSISSDWFEDKFNDLGFEQPQFSIPRFKVEKIPVQEISDRQARQLIIQMEKWLASDTQSGRSAFIYTFFGLFCGMRAGDICSLKWDIIKNTTNGMMLVYTPHKTLHSSGKSVSFPLSSKTYCMIEPLIGKPDEYLIPRLENRTPNGLVKDGTYSGMHLYLRRKVNKAISSIGIGNEYRGQKKFHATRKYFSTDMVYSVGKEMAASFCCHSVDTQQRSYCGSLYGKVA